jgi:hypothetical protein
MAPGDYAITTAAMAQSAAQTDKRPAPAAESKLAWHVPMLEEIDYAETQVISGPGVFSEGAAACSVP